MSDKEYEISAEPLWYLPDPIRERLTSESTNQNYAHFQFCGLYSVVAVTALTIFGIAALGRGEIIYAMVQFGFAVTTILAYFGIWMTRAYYLASHLSTGLMALLCLYLFYTGGTLLTGPLYLFVFPLVAMFLQGTVTGVYSVTALFLTLALLYLTGWFGFNTQLYTPVFFVRVMTVYFILSLLAYTFSASRHKAERELMLTVNDLQQLSNADLETGLANRRLLEKLLHTEIKRFQRYNIPCSVVMIEPDNVSTLQLRYGSGYRGYINQQLVEAILQQTRELDVPGRWESNCFMVLLPGASADGTHTFAERLLEDLRSSSTAVLQSEIRVTYSIGIAQMQNPEPELVLARADANLREAADSGGNKIVES